MKKEQQVQQLSHLIVEFYRGAKVYQVDEVEERVYFIDEEGDDIQAVIDREHEEVQFKYLRGEDWYDIDSASFDNVNEINEVPFL